MNIFWMPLIIYIPVGIYFYFFFTRFMTLFGLEKKSARSRALSVLGAILCILVGWRVYGLGSVLILYFLAFCLLMELINVLIKGRLKSAKTKKIWSVLYRSGAVGVLAVGLITLYGFYNMQQIRQTDYTIETDKEIEEGFKIAQISDLHMGTTMDAEKLRDICGRIEDNEPDILALTGDIFDERTTLEEMKAAAEILGGVKTAFGVYYVYGNHDYNTFWDNPKYTAEELKTVLAGEGIRVLEDESVLVTDGLTVVGHRDFYSDREAISSLTEGIEEDSFVLLLDHQPREFAKSKAAGVDLQLSGHTHGGQIWPTGWIGEVFGGVDKNYGLETDGTFQVVVSSGVAGWGYAMRTGSHSEYVIVTVE